MHSKSSNNQDINSSVNKTANHRQSSLRASNNLSKSIPAIQHDQKPNQSRRLILNSITLLLAFSLGFVLANYRDISAAPIMQNINPGVESDTNIDQGIDLKPLWEAWSLLESKFVSDSEAVTNQMKLYGLIEGLAESYDDPYTEFFTPTELERFNESVEGGSFSGVGMEIGLSKDGLLRVVAPLKESPAEAAGIKSGDIILKIDDTSTLDISLNQALSLIRGESGTIVQLQVARESAEETLEISVERAEIDIPVLRTKVEDGVFIISIYSFSADLDDRFRGALREYQDSSADSLIIDLRNNPGGYLMSAVELGSWFADAGEVLVRERLGSSSSQDNRLYRSKGYYLEKLRTEPLAVLVNQGSASASEIFAGIIQDYDLGVVIGENTFGKGSVQELIPLRGDTAIKITTARWLTPNGRSISDGGLEPDVIIEDDQETVEIDEQLDKALDLLKSN